MNPLQAILDAQGVVILDGALATELEKRGADLNHELWSARLLLENPAAIEELHYDYFCAGADVAITASYQASFEGFQRIGLSRTEAGRLIQQSVSVAVQARKRFEADIASGQQRIRPLVAASIGPYGAILHNGSEYTGDYRLTREELKDFHRPRMVLLDDTEADLFALETIPSQLEARALLELLTEFPRRQAWLSFSCKDEHAVCHGEAFAECAELAAEHDQILAVGINCSPPEIILPLLRSAAGLGKPLLAYPNSGERYDAADNSWSAPETEMCSSGPADLTDLAAQWQLAGASLLGGCCRTSVDDIRAIRKRLLVS